MSRAICITHSRCSCVSGTAQPRAAAIRSHAVAGSTPLEARTQAASRAALPTPCRQWIAIFFPHANSGSKRRTNSQVSFAERGTPRSAIGKTKNSIPAFSHCSFSWIKSNSAISSFVSADTIASIPKRCQEEISSSSQSPPRGRGMMANRPSHGPSIQYSSVRMFRTHAQHHFPPTRIKSWAFSSNAAITASSSDNPDALNRFCVSRTRR